MCFPAKKSVLRHELIQDAHLLAVLVNGDVGEAAQPGWVYYRGIRSDAPSVCIHVTNCAAYTSCVPIREVKIYDRAFPRHDELLFGDPGARPPCPREVWSEQMTLGELALFCTDGKTGLARSAENGKFLGNSGQVCFVGDVSELRQRAREIVKQFPACVCLLKNKHGKVVSSIQNTSVALKFGLICLGVPTIAAIAVSGAAYLFYVAFVSRHPPRLGAVGWLGFLIAALVSGALLIFLLFWLRVKAGIREGMKRADEWHAKIATAFTAEEKIHFRALDRLLASADPEEQRQGRDLAREYSQRLREITNARK